jgi:hypothetical protein
MESLAREGGTDAGGGSSRARKFHFHQIHFRFAGLPAAADTRRAEAYKQG